MTLQAREARLRHIAKGKGLRLMKRRPRKDPLLAGYMIVDGECVIVAGADPIPFSLDLAGVRRVLAGPVEG